ncbi:RagB/SusD family nutrient uptake outer membrane protein [Christiangramia flava]|uniref:Putative outer membrane protein involved in nutrient binding n=1 Tax=Christiangramia flava JLT2011 TaxID=1229726 RepID=A0A1L7I5W3_9FLAO|nr:RagB/SusD family nutrient uptake outer membrane protein [Christiangramia flava]APU68980.1 putative outer membrane protein involved in nutrient binding [Christiangramia flava JLT2011]OSS38546.1 putative outer membrane protein [Christiangramia flava JLT2011]
MNNRISSLRKIFGTVFCVLTLLSCQKDFLDQVPKDSLTEETVWSDPQGATQFVNAIYGEMPSGFDRWYDGWAKGLYLFDGASDDGDVSMGWTHSTLLQNAEFLPTYVPWGNMWSNYYNLIRKANVALENLDRLEDEELRTRLKGEVYFLRGFMYHKLLRLFGYRSSGGEATGVPLVTTSLSLDDDLAIPRATYSEVVSQIISDLDTAASLLPAKGGIEEGRATSGAAIAFKGRVLMYAEKWAESASASNQIITNANYSLFPDYKTLFLTKNNEEIIFAKKFLYPDKHHQTNAGGTQNAGWDVYNTPPSYRGVSDGGWGGNLPTQNFVDSYDMVDGLPQDESPLYDSEKPWDNLDPRFEATVVHNGAMFRGREVELFVGGRDIQFINTGYFLRKFHNEDLVIYSQSSDQDWIFMRYAEVLLNYAEAQNEAVGPDATVYSAINQIRGRAGMPELQSGLSQDQMREKIRNERRIELAFEEHRFFDIRRWEIAPNVLNGPVYGIQLTPNGDGTFEYNRIEVEERPFPEKMYVLPIPQDEIDKNPAATQILGW